MTAIEYGGEYPSKVTESRYNADNVLTGEHYSLYDEYGSVTCVRRTLPANDEGPSPTDVDYVYERDSRGNILKSTATYPKGTVSVTEKSYDEDDHVIEEKVTLTTSAGESSVSDWRTREYEADGHSYTERWVWNGVDMPGMTLNDGDITAIFRYKFLPLSEAIAQQDISGEVTYETPTESSGGAEVYAGPYGSTLTKISDEGNWGTWKLVILKGDRRYEDTITFEVKNYVNSQTGQYNGMYERTENTYKITFNQSEAMFALGPEYSVMEFVRQ